LTVYAIGAINDNLGSIGYVSGGTTTSVLANDSVGGAAVGSGNVTVVLVSQSGPGTTLTLNSNGMLTVPPNAVVGTYQVTYQICTTATPTKCDTAIATLNVTGSVTVMPDTALTLVGHSVGTVVTANDSAPVGSSVTTSGTSAHGGTVTCGPTAPATCTYTPQSGYIGTDTYTYTVCAPAPNASLCGTGTVTVSVLAPAPAAIPLVPWWWLTLGISITALLSGRPLRTLR
jgi:hypothetical protein